MSWLTSSVRRALSWRLGRPPLRDPLAVIAEAYQERSIGFDWPPVAATSTAGVMGVELVAGDELFDLRATASTVALRGLSPEP